MRSSNCSTENIVSNSGATGSSVITANCSTFRKGLTAAHFGGAVRPVSKLPPNARCKLTR
jgi:hypothetical protein